MRERIRSLMRNEKQAHEHNHHGHAASSGVPHAMVLTACCVSEPPVSDAECTTVTWTYGLRRRPCGRQRRPAIRGAGRRAGITRLGPSAREVVVSPGNKKGPEHCCSAPVQSPAHRTPCASTASRPAHRDDRETPLNNGAGQTHHKRGLKGGDKFVRIFCVKPFPTTSPIQNEAQIGIERLQSMITRAVEDRGGREA